MIPVNIISGFFGSGKTTAIIKLLLSREDSDRWAVIINEFGKISIDSQTLSSSITSTGSVFDISGGCICCSAKEYFRENLVQIIDSVNFSRILIEPSGLGGIEMISAIVSEIPELLLMPVICMVDIGGIYNPRIQMNPIYQKQIRKSDIIIFSKLDLASSEPECENLTGEFRSFFPEKEYHTSLSTAITTVPSVATPQRARFQRVLSDTDYREHSYRFDPAQVFDWDRFSQHLSAQTSVVRAKGYILTTSGWRFFNYTLTGMQSESCAEKEAGLVVVISYKSQNKVFEFDSFRG